MLIFYILKFYTNIVNVRIFDIIKIPYELLT